MSINIKRCKQNPIITTADIKPSTPNFKVDGVFNAGVAKYKDEVILLLRVAESVETGSEDVIAVPTIDTEGRLIVKYYNKKEEKDKIDFSDNRTLKRIVGKGREVHSLTSLSHFRLARSKDGINFKVDEKPWIFPEDRYERWGIEDPRITKIDDNYYINYTAVSDIGAATALIVTKDFDKYERLGIIFPPENKDVTIFPEKINGLYYAYHRPVPSSIGKPNMWISTSTNLTDWGNHEILMNTSKGWESGRVGGGGPSIKTEKGWLHIYHGADENNRYCLGAFITELNDPSKIIKKANQPILIPEKDYEINGFFGNVVFTCGVLKEGNTIRIYYGASDEVMALAEIEIDEIFKFLEI